MGSRLLPVLVSLLIGLSSAAPQPGDAIEALAKHFSNSDAPKISAYFSSTLELHILSEMNVYSKAQAEQIMRNFFSKNKPVSVRIVHRLTSNPNYKLAVLSLATADDAFRISISLSNSGDRFLIKQIRIEQDKQ